MKIENNKLIKVEDKDIQNGTFIIPNSVISIGKKAFANCLSLEKITIPDSIKYICASAFENCYFLESVTIPNSLVYIGNDVFWLCNALTNINIYSYKTFSLLDKSMKLNTVLSTLKNYYNNKIEYTKEDIEKFTEYVKICKSMIKLHMIRQDGRQFFLSQFPCRNLNIDKETIHILLFKMDDFMTQKEALELLEKSNDNEVRAMLLEYNKKFKVDPFEKFNLDDDFDDNKKYYKK